MVPSEFTGFTPCVTAPITSASSEAKLVSATAPLCSTTSSLHSDTPTAGADVFLLKENCLETLWVAERERGGGVVKELRNLVSESSLSGSGVQRIWGMHMWKEPRERATIKGTYSHQRKLQWLQVCKEEVYSFESITTACLKL